MPYARNLSRVARQAPDLQAAGLALEAVDGAEPMAERTLLAAHAGTEAEQRVRLDFLR